MWWYVYIQEYSILSQQSRKPTLYFHVCPLYPKNQNQSTRDDGGGSKHSYKKMSILAYTMKRCFFTYNAKPSVQL